MLDGHPGDIPKEELLHLCMKLNKRMQTMETKGRELLKKKNVLSGERDKLVKLMEDAVGCPLLSSPDADLDLALVEDKWSAVVKGLTAGPAAVGAATATTADSSAPPATAIALDVPSDGSERLRAQDSLFKDQLRSLEGQLAGKQAELDKLTKQVEDLKLHGEEQVVFFQMQLNAAKQREEALGGDLRALQARAALQSKHLEERDVSVQSNREMLQALQSRLIELEPELAQAKDKATTLQVLRMEQDNLVKSLRGDLKAAAEERDTLTRRCRELEEGKIKSDGASLKLAALTEQLAALAEQADSDKILVQRLRTEAAANERNHAMRTAQLAAAEAQVETLQADLAKRDATAAELVERVSSLQTNQAALEHTLAEKVAHYLQAIAQLEKDAAQRQVAHRTELAAAQAAHEEALDGIKKDFAKKSSMARTILSEREEEARVLAQKVAQLQEEINSGAPTERKIFEIAQLQSQRDAFNEQHRDSRDVSFQKLQRLLAARDLELAQAQQVYAALHGEVQELRRVRQREGVNMDYLKNVVLQYMTLPQQSTEKQSLVGVIGMLLQFSPKEVGDAMGATRNPVYAALPVKEVKRLSVQAPSSVSRLAPHGQAVGPSRATSAQAQGRRPLSAEEADFQEKLNKISGDILSMSVSYDEQEDSL